ncbi:hypothetical protein GQ43DRAFT_440639 [Delitschia confertaspora ATCC 74209]|uniref:Secreted protein n=1 Tax=Delitschia confertaspora ATCC 74209 TaxID=1513339 RepID=A0A9P4MYZ8_9PLEO|nr:hypothetical protein GQ43DRAFT_440639 [Delitschia confertaspora ATCC 74209]
MWLPIPWRLMVLITVNLTTLAFDTCCALQITLSAAQHTFPNATSWLSGLRIISVNYDLSHPVQPWIDFKQFIPA